MPGGIHRKRLLALSGVATIMLSILATHPAHDPASTAPGGQIYVVVSSNAASTTRDGQKLVILQTGQTRVACEGVIDTPIATFGYTCHAINPKTADVATGR
jgi:hypothetical protein